MSRISALGVLCLVASLALGGCIFSPEKGSKKPPPPPSYPLAQNPGVALENLITAYAARDSVGYRKALAYPEYHGLSTDQTDGTQVELFWIDEVRHVQKFAAATTIASTRFDLGTPSTWRRLESDDPGHPEWALIQIAGSNFLLIVDDTDRGTLTVSSPNETHFFRFRPTLDSSSPTDTLWTLAEWEEVIAP